MVIFDAEFPDRVPHPLGELCSRFSAIRVELLGETPLDGILFSLTKAILTFFSAVDSSDLKALRCKAGDLKWLQFSDELLPSDCNKFDRDTCIGSRGADGTERHGSLLIIRSEGMSDQSDRLVQPLAYSPNLCHSNH